MGANQVPKALRRPSTQVLIGSLVRLVNYFSTSLASLAAGSLYPELPAGGELVHVPQKGSNTVKLDFIHHLRAANSTENLLNL